jgi:hypothetical protein
MSPLREPMPSEPSRTDEVDEDRTDVDDETDEEVSDTAVAAGDSATTSWSSLACSRLTWFSNVF